MLEVYRAHNSHQTLLELLQTHCPAVLAEDAEEIYHFHRRQQQRADVRVLEQFQVDVERQTALRLVELINGTQIGSAQLDDFSAAVVFLLIDVQVGQSDGKIELLSFVQRNKLEQLFKRQVHF